MKKIRQLFAGRRKNPCIFAVLFVLCLAAELFLSNWRDFSIGDAPETVLPAEALTRADGAELLDDGTIRVNGAGAELEFTGLSVNARTITIHTLHRRARCPSPPAFCRTTPASTITRTAAFCIFTRRAATVSPEASSSATAISTASCCPSTGCGVLSPLTRSY